MPTSGDSPQAPLARGRCGCRGRRMIRPRLRAALAAFVALLQPLAAAPLGARTPHHAATIRPALWELTGKGSTIWLFGTIHALPPHFEWETPLLRATVAKADRLVIEAVIDRDSGDAAAAMMKLGVAAAPQPALAERVPVASRAKLADMAKRAGVPLATLDRLKTWAAGMVLFGATVTGLGVSAADGVEEQLKADFKAAGKPVEGLETVEQQLGFFDRLSEAQQREFLASVLDDDGNDAADFGKMLGAWSHGDERGIQASFDKDMKATDALQSVLIAERDRRWADTLVERLARPGTTLVAVGAGHLVGPNSVQAMLAKLGYAVKRVE
jgi:uncharacterized protein YbaP (TraB family)